MENIASLILQIPRLQRIHLDNCKVNGPEDETLLLLGKAIERKKNFRDIILMLVDSNKEKVYSAISTIFSLHSSMSI
jgi:hypothetical protein